MLLKKTDGKHMWVQLSVKKTIFFSRRIDCNYVLHILEKTTDKQLKNRKFTEPESVRKLH